GKVVLRKGPTGVGCGRGPPTGLARARWVHPGPGAEEGFAVVAAKTSRRPPPGRGGRGARRCWAAAWPAPLARPRTGAGRCRRAVCRQCRCTSIATHHVHGALTL